MAKGRPKILDEVKKLRGTDQPCRMAGENMEADKISNISEITSTAKLKMLPTKRSKDIFKRKANQLIALGVLTELDIEQLALYAYSLDFVFSSFEEIRKSTSEGGRIFDRINKSEMSMLYKAMDYVNRIGAEFGFTPMSRQKISISRQEEKDELEELANNIG